MDLLKVKNDFVFKKIFGEPGCEENLRPLLEAILKVRISELTIRLDRTLEQDLLGDKVGIIDVFATMEGGVKVNIEIQVGREYNLAKRTFFYLSRLYAKDFKEGEKYDGLKKTVAINILDYVEFNDHVNCHHKFQWKDELNNATYFDDVAEIHILELDKITSDNMEDSDLLDWLGFIRAENGDEFLMYANKNDDIKKAYDSLKDLSSDEDARIQAERREKWLITQRSNLHAAKEEGMKEGLEKGLEKGRVEERAFLAIMMIKNLLADEPELQIYTDAVKEMTEPTLLELFELITMGDKQKVKDFILEKKK